MKTVRGGNTKANKHLIVEVIIFFFLKICFTGVYKNSTFNDKHFTDFNVL